LHNPRALSILALALIAIGMGSGLPATAEEEEENGPRFQFNPSLAIGLTTTDNVNYLDSPTLTTSNDQSAELTATAPMERRFRTGTWDLTYEGYWTRYSDHDALNHSAHYVDTGFRFNPTRRSTLRVNGVYTLTQLQAVARPVPDFVTGDDLFVGERQTVRAYGLGTGYRLEIGPTWSWDSSISGSTANVKPIDGYDDSSPALSRQDTRSFLARTRVERERSERFTLGGEYQYSRFDLSGSGLEDVHELSVTATRKLGRKSSIAGELGAYRRSHEAGETTTSYRNDGALVSLFYSYTPTTGLTARAGLSVVPSSGGTLQGTSTNRTIQAFLNGNHEHHRLYWEVGGYQSVREASDETVPTLEVLSLTGSIEHAIRTLFGLRLQTTWVDQSSDVEGYSEAKYYSVSLSCVWYPLGRTRVAGG
jgi:hypothetical protein